MNKYLHVASSLLFALLLSGCGGDGPAKYSVTGSVQLDGAPLPEGDITFEPKTKTLHPGQSNIKDGKYSTQLENGSYAVKIQARKKVPLGPGEVSASGEKEKLVPIIPPQFNDKTTLAVDVSGATNKDFQVTSK